MNILYLCQYKQRFKDIVDLLSKSNRNIFELCFGNVNIAKECKKEIY